MALSDLIVRLRADATDFSRKWAEVQQSLNLGAAQAVASASGFRALGSVMTQAGAAATAGLTLPIVGLGVAALKSAGETEKAVVAFQRFTGSVQGSKALIADLQRVADQSDLTFSDLLQGSRRITTFAKDAGDTTRIVRILTDTISGAGGNGENFNAVARALQQIAAKGKLSAEEMNQLSDAGVQAGAGLAKQFGVSQARLQELTQRGLIPADAAIQGILRALESDFRGAAQAQAGTLLGIWSTVRDQAEGTARVIGQVLTPAAKRIATEFVQPSLEKLKELAKGFADLDPATQNAAIGIAAVVAAAPPMILVAGQMTAGLSSLLSVLRLIPFAAIAGSALNFATSLSGSVIPGLQAVRLTGLGASVAIGGIGLAAAAAVPELIRLAQSWLGMREAQQDAAKASRAADDALSLTREVILQRGGDISQLSTEYRKGQISLAQYEKGLRDQLVTLTNQQGPLQRNAAATKTTAAEALKLNAEVGKLAASPLPRWFTETSVNAERAVAALRQVRGALPGNFLENLVREEVLQRDQSALKVAQQAITDFVTAGQEGGKKLRIEDAFRAAATSADLLGDSAATATQRVLRLLDLGNTGGTNLPLRSSANNSIIEGLTGPLAQARVEQAGLRAEADRLGAVYQQVAAAAGGSSAIARRAYQEWVQAEQKAAAVTSQGGQRAAGSLREVSTILTNLNQRIAETIVQWNGWGSLAVGIVRQIGTAITAELIGKLILTEKRMTAISSALGKVLSKIPGLGKVFGGGTIPAPGSVGGSAGSAAGSAAGGAGNAAGSAASIAQSGLQAGLSLAFAGVSAVTGIIGNVLAFKTGKDTARLEVTARQIFAEVSNIRTDNWTQHNGGAAFLPAIAESINRFGDAHGRYLSEMLASLQRIAGGGQLAASGGGGLTVIVQGNVIGTTIQALADELQRAIKGR